ncbi:MAG: tRNA (adenosine(37)-N6)-dimethylallyltransferase MiaA [Firmicutes bacterium]|nr:tRNA (adenosine(37)-N6)-dimethylallyltransferase MiaA [Bacillota bacterium]
MASTENKVRLLVIVGPTAVGKSAVAVEVARRLPGAIVSADSMQVYRGMNIGTGKIRPEEAKGIPHYLLDVCEPDEPFNVARYVELADAAIAEICAQGLIPIIVGGTGLYIRALVDGFLFETPPADADFRKQMRLVAEREGNEALHQRLQLVDPESAARIHPNDIRRVIRALEIFHTTGESLSEKAARAKELPKRYEASFYGLTAPRPFVYERINRRVDQMIEQGLVGEVMNLLQAGFSSQLTSNQAIGYKEIVDYLSGKATFAEAVDNLKKVTRNYAKRQLSWFRADSRIQWLNVCDYPDSESLAEAIVADFRKGFRS